MKTDELMLHRLFMSPFQGFGLQIALKGRQTLAMWRKPIAMMNINSYLIQPKPNRNAHFYFGWNALHLYWNPLTFLNNS